MKWKEKLTDKMGENVWLEVLYFQDADFWQSRIERAKFLAEIVGGDYLGADETRMYEGKRAVVSTFKLPNGQRFLTEEQQNNLLKKFGTDLKFAHSFIPIEHKYFNYPKPVEVESH